MIPSNAELLPSTITVNYDGRSGAPSRCLLNLARFPALSLLIRLGFRRTLTWTEARRPFTGERKRVRVLTLRRARP